jgi:hypothetical protein
MKNNKSLLKSKSGLFELGMKLLGLSKVSFNETRRKSHNQTL